MSKVQFERLFISSNLRKLLENIGGYTGHIQKLPEKI